MKKHELLQRMENKMQNLGLSLLIFPLKRKPRMLAMFAHVENAKETGFLSGSCKMKTNSLHPGPAPKFAGAGRGNGSPIQHPGAEQDPASPSHGCRGHLSELLSPTGKKEVWSHRGRLAPLPHVSSSSLPSCPPTPKMCTREGAHLLWSPPWLSPAHLAVTHSIAMRAWPCTCPALHKRALHLCRGLRQEAHQRLRVYLSHRWSSRTPFPACFAGYFLLGLSIPCW